MVPIWLVTGIPLQVMQSVKGNVIIGPDAVPFANATVAVFVEDVSLQDASSKILAKTTIPDISHEVGNEDSVPFRVEIEGFDPRASYSVRVHIAVQGTNEIHRGDLITMQSYPVLSFGHSNRVDVNVREVK